MLKDKVYIIGVPADIKDGLSPRTKRIIRGADLLYGGKRLLSMFPSAPALKISITDNLESVSQSIKSEIGQKRIVVLASGDPNFFGIAAYLISRLGKEVVEIIPGVSSMQLAFARIKESWEDAVFISVHGRPLEQIIEKVRTHPKVCILTDSNNTPSAIARELLNHGLSNYKAYVCQDLGTEREKVISTDLPGLEGQEFSALNLLILIHNELPRDPPAISEQVLGLPESRFRLRSPEKSLITKTEIRAISLAKLGLREDSLVWDIGAGSGSISIEASMLAHRGQVFAIEKNQADVAVIKENAARFNRSNITVIQATAPQGLEIFPEPTAVFIGGSGGQMPAILKLVCDRIQTGGRIVINAATLENLQSACAGLTAKGFKYEITLVNIARSHNILDLTRFEALNPVYIITGWRSNE